MEKYIIDGTIRTFHVDSLEVIDDFRDRERTVNDPSELLSRFLVTFPIQAEVDLITGVVFLVASARMFVKVVLVSCLGSFEFVLRVCNLFQEPLFPIPLELYRAGEDWLENIRGDRNGSS